MLTAAVDVQDKMVAGFKASYNPEDHRQLGGLIESNEDYSPEVIGQIMAIADTKKAKGLRTLWKVFHPVSTVPKDMSEYMTAHCNSIPPRCIYKDSAETHGRG